MKYVINRYSSSLNSHHPRSSHLPTRYVEELKMYADLEDSRHGGLDTSDYPGARFDPQFLALHWQYEVEQEWPLSKIRSDWLHSLRALEAKLQEAIAAIGCAGDANATAAFVKLSVRSPKDSVFNVAGTYSLVHQRLQSLLAEPPSSPYILGQDVDALRWASWQYSVRTPSLELRSLASAEHSVLIHP